MIKASEPGKPMVRMAETIARLRGLPRPLEREVREPIEMPERGGDMPLPLDDDGSG